MKHYISNVIGDGIDPDINPFLPSLIDLIPDLAWGATDGREDMKSSAGTMLVACDPTPAQHMIIIADTRNEYVGET